MEVVKKVLTSKTLFTAAGCAALVYLISNYGLGTLWEDLREAGGLSVLLVLTFLPTLVCYSLAWLLCSDLPGAGGSPVVNGRRAWVFTRMMAISIAWNNLTPFLKAGGEPAKVWMLKDYLGFRKALQSTFVYNLVHAIALVVSWVLLALALLCFYSAPAGVRLAETAIVVVGSALLALTFHFPGTPKRLLRRALSKRGRSRNILWLRKALIGLRWISRETVSHFRRHPRRVAGALALEVAARFIEGLTFYWAFLLISHPVSFVNCALLDVGRTLVDTICFFIPYQVGAREQGVLFLLHDVLGQPASGYLAATVFYRAVEVFWIAVGYALWTRSSRAERSPI
jgi:uncharacterized membrane protein YbhN (UPF0104 family)